MTIRQLKRSMDARFRQVDRRFTAIDRRFVAVDQRFVSVDQRFAQLEQRIQDTEVRLGSRIRESEERLHRHFDVVVESLHDDMRTFAEAIGLHSERLGDHETRLRRLERR